jgi:hypothetical protein
MTAPDETGGAGSQPPDPPAGSLTPEPLVVADGAPAPGAPSRAGGVGVLAAGGVALGMHLMVGAAYALTLLLAPLWVNVLLALWWVALLLAGLLLLARRSLWVLAVPLVAIASWAALVAAGRAWFGWH